MPWIYKFGTQQELPSRQDVEEILQRMYYQHKEFFREEGILTWKQWLNSYSSHEIGLTLESDFYTYDTYFKHLPEDIMASDVVDMYKQNTLPSTTRQPYVYPQDPITHTTVRTKKLPWESRTYKSRELTKQQAQETYQIASQRLNKSNSNIVLEARKNLFIAFNTDKQLADKLDINLSKLTQLMKKYSGLSSRMIHLQDYLNHNIPDEHKWVGISNSSFITKQHIKPEDMDKFVRSIKITPEGHHFYFGDPGEQLRRDILNAFMSIDTRINYRDLNFEIGECNKPTTNGTYKSKNKTIIIANLGTGTVAHEIGHYLDDKWGKEIGLTAGVIGPEYLTDTSLKTKWALKLRTFIKDLSHRSDIHSEYTQRPGEVFARFIERFVNWANQRRSAALYLDKFTEQDFKTFVRILQEKSYLDSLISVTKDSAH